MEFNYKAKNREGSFIEGKVEAPTEDQAVYVLQQKELLVLFLEATEKPFFSADLMQFFSKPSRKDIVIFTRQLATLIDADVPLIECLHTLTRQIEKPSFRKVISSTIASIEGGASLSLALSEHEVFGKFYISLVRAGEVSGKLQSTLTYLADYMERSSGLNSKIRGALAYPMFILFAIVVVSIVMMTMVLPNLLSIFKESGIKDLPVTTVLLISVTNFFNSYIVIILAALIGGGILFFRFIKTENGRTKWDKFKLNVPQFGKLIRNFYIARFSESFSTLIKSGVPILEGMNIVADVVNNNVYRDIILEARTNVQGGGTISEVFEKYSEVPYLVSSMLSVGEKTGRTDFMLDNITRFYKAETENAVQNLTQLIEPVLILFLGLAVGILVAAVLLPIYSMIGAG